MEKSLHLKDRQEYIDRYDRMTVEHCRRIEEIFYERKPLLYKGKKLKKEQVTQVTKAAKDWCLYLETGEMYAKKYETIQKWMDEDKAKDDFYESAEAPIDIRCLMCRNRVVPMFKEFWYEPNKKDRILFMYECPNRCLPRRAFFSDGEEWRPKSHLCPRCSYPFKSKTKDDKEKLITTYTCPKCKYSETEDYTWSKKEEDKLDENYAVDRDRFCLTDKDGWDYQEGKRNREELKVLLDKIDDEEKARKEKLKENPEGFAIEGRGRSCSVCGKYSQDEDSWYDKWGIKCLICQKAIDRKEIPGSIIKFKDSWYSSWDLQSRFNLKSPTIRKWVRDGIIKARTISHYGKGIHAQIFLIKDNKDFLPPKKITESRGVNHRKNGEDWFTTAEWYKFADARKEVEKYKIMNYIKIVEVEKEKQDD